MASQRDIAAIILAAGMGTRMKSARHKVLHPVAGRSLLGHVLDSADAAGIARRVIVVGASREQVEDAFPNEAFAVQEPQHGTGHAVGCAREALLKACAADTAESLSGDVIILYGDVPFVSADTMTALVAARRDDAHGGAAAIAVLGFRPADAAAYGRLVQNEAGDLEAIVEFKDASEAERAIDLCNSGIMAVKASLLFDLIDGLQNDNAAQEYYLTDIVALARQGGHRVAVMEVGESEVMGVNSRAELAVAEGKWQDKRRTQAMDDGVSLIAPDTVWFSYDTVLGPDTTIHPNVVLGPGVTVESGATLHAFSHLEGCTISSGASVGPYARLRPGADIGAGVKIGNFVEVKKSVIEAGAKVSHLSYIGDARVGACANIGAGTITCNYDGYGKFFTDIGKNAFIGSNTALVAPVTIGEGAIVGAGSTITKDVDSDALGVTRAEQKQLSGWAAAFRQKKAK